MAVLSELQVHPGPAGDAAARKRLRFTVLNTSITVDPEVFGILLALWGILSWLAGRKHPSRRWPVRLLVGALSASLLMLADLGHALAHIFSARQAGAPMDEILISADMPRTIYYDNNVAPAVHRMRALGGPIYSALGLSVSQLVRAAAPRQSLVRELAEWSSLGHGLILAGSLAPLPIVDGGTLLKWTLVEHGRTPAAADQAVKQAGLATGSALIGIGATLATRRRRLLGMGLMIAGAVAAAVALGKIR